MTDIPDNLLISEIRKKFREKDRMLADLNHAMRKLEEVNRKLEESERLKSNFISNIRNEINNPMTSIMSLAGILRHDDVDIDNVRSIGAYIYEDAFNLDIQLRNIFAAADIEAGDVSIRSSPVKVAELVHEVVSSFHHQIQEKKLVVEVENGGIPADRCVETDLDRVKLIVSNLVSNAVKFSHSVSTVKIAIGISGGLLTISIHNQGPEIKKEDMDRIFDRFVQLDVGMSKSYSGQGLGLSIAKACVELLSGRISVSSEAGKGCTFTVTLPEMEVIADQGVVAAGEELFFFDEEERF